MIPPKSFYLLRHGETVANAEGYASGSLDTPLTEKGREQAVLTQKTLMELDRKPQIIFHSPLSRAKDTADLVNSTLNLPMISHSGLKEQHYGDWQGRNWDIIKSEMKHGEDPPNGESQKDFFTRAQKAIAECLSQTDQIPLLTCHGGIFEAFFSYTGHGKVRIVNCALYEFWPDQKGRWQYRDHTNLSTLAIALFEGPRPTK
ncbi:MAG TPA: histidine phosphatase family protein [Alphaproteobacteria bacterium]|nr:histidine phosphatase family protein [Alphaproteobacteria bacterium]HNS43726.1 histidine phosphatase family protein [Alphaproteobacteria bacterium]